MRFSFSCALRLDSIWPVLNSYPLTPPNTNNIQLFFFSLLTPFTSSTFPTNPVLTTRVHQNDTWHHRQLNIDCIGTRERSILGISSRRCVHILVAAPHGVDWEVMISQVGGARFCHVVQWYCRFWWRALSHKTWASFLSHKPTHTSLLCFAYILILLK